MSMSKTAAAVSLALLVLSLQACGRKGPLYIQQPPVQPLPALSVQGVVKPDSTNQAKQNPVNPNLSIQSQPVQAQPETQK